MRLCRGNFLYIEMQYILLVVIFSVAVINNTTCSLMNKALSQLKSFAQLGDPGEPLYLTNYIERGELLKVGEKTLNNLPIII